jgi:hypothetical protein
MQLPSVERGVIGFTQRMPVFPFVSFSVRDNDLIIVEGLTGEQRFTVSAAAYTQRLRRSRRRRWPPDRFRRRWLVMVYAWLGVYVPRRR